MTKRLNETNEPEELNESEEKTFADWFGKDLTGQTYDGDIDCSQSGLTSLKGAPKIVKGDFDCHDNKLTSLEGAPQEVGGDFDCSLNRLDSLDGGPETVNGYFWCDDDLEIEAKILGYNY